MSTGNPILDKAIALAHTAMSRPDGRCFCRPSVASGLREITPRVYEALKLAREAAPHLQRQVFLARKMAQAQALAGDLAGKRTARALKEALSALPEEVIARIERLQADFQAQPPTPEEKDILETAGFGTYA